jgi:hypothetical protein
MMVLKPVMIRFPVKLSFHPLGEKAKSHESRNKQFLQKFTFANLWFEEGTAIYRKAEQDNIKKGA